MRGSSDSVGKSQGCWHLGSARMDADGCLAVLAASRLPLVLEEAAPSHVGKLHLQLGCSSCHTLKGSGEQGAL